MQLQFRVSRYLQMCEVFVSLAKLFIPTLNFSLETMPGGSLRTVGPLCADQKAHNTGDRDAHMPTLLAQKEALG